MRPRGDPGRRGPSQQWLPSARDGIRAQLYLDLVADAASATWARRGLAAWLGIDVDGERRDDIVLAAYEAVANAAEHAYAGAPTGRMSLTAHRRPAEVQVTVADQGHWRADTGDPFRSRGLFLMRQLMTEVEVITDENGTVVHLHMALPGSDDEESGTDGRHPGEGWPGEF